MRPYHACRLPQPATRHPLPSMHACHCVPMLAPPATPPGLWHTCMRVTAPVTRLFLDLLHLAPPTCSFMSLSLRSSSALLC